VYPNNERVGEEVDDNTFFIYLHKEPVDICDGLDMTFGREQVEVDVKGKLVSAQRYQTVVKAAPFLQVYFQNQRSIMIANADGTREQRTELVDHPVQVPSTINIERWMANPNPALLQLREESWKLRERRQALRDERSKLLATEIEEIEGPDALDATYQWITSAGDELGGDISAITADLKAKADADRTRGMEIVEQVEEITADLKSLPFDKYNTPDKEYSLFAVFIHRGNAQGGHYWIYIRDFINNKWRKYNDSTVEVINNIDTVIGGNSTTLNGRPNLVVYVRNDQKDVLTEPLHRVEPEREDEGISDVEMLDATQPQTVDPKSEFTVMELDGVDDDDATQSYHG
jgi:ubiquitin carboxyl-terminal hydrolase 25/28